MLTKGIVVAGLAGGSGKSVVSVGLTAYLTGEGVNVVPFKKGPDYIDAGWMALAAGKDCCNLDPYLMTEEAIHSSFLQNCHGADIVIVEGNRGLYDGVNSSGGYSTAELAISLKLPVLLVVNCTKTTRTAAAMVLGCQMLDRRIDIRGVILNEIATKRQKDIITQAVEETAGIPVLGIIPRMKKDIFPMRHLGMVPHQEYQNSDAAISLLAETVAESVDIQGIEKVMADVSLVSPDEVPRRKRHISAEKIKIGVIQDTAFQFYYSENLKALEDEGAELVPVNALQDEKLPDLDGLYIGGGFPETSAKELTANSGFRKSMKQAADDGLPIYAECGGLIYLGESIVLDGVEYPLAGIFPVRFGMSAKPQAHGYTIFEVDKSNPFYDVGTTVKGHEFRYSTILEWCGNEQDLVLKMKRGKGFSGGRDGLCYNNVLALYTHVHAYGTPEWARGIVNICRTVKQHTSPNFS
jgi:cobyrinic acid a,c-diamide synthase